MDCIWPIIEDIIEGCFSVDAEAPRPTLSIPKPTMNNAQWLAEDIETIEGKGKGFYIALDKNLKMIFVLIRSGLNLVHGNKVGKYVTKAMGWNIEEYAWIQPARIPRDSEYKEYEEWLLPWSGYRYCIVSTCHEHVKSEPLSYYYCLIVFPIH